MEPLEVTVGSAKNHLTIRVEQRNEIHVWSFERHVFTPKGIEETGWEVEVVPDEHRYEGVPDSVLRELGSQLSGVEQQDLWSDAVIQMRGMDRIALKNLAAM